MGRVQPIAAPLTPDNSVNALAFVAFFKIIDPAADDEVPMVKEFALPAVRVVNVPAAGVPVPKAGGAAADPPQLDAVA